MRLIDADALPKLFDAEYKQTMKLIWEGEKHLDTLAEGFAEAIHIAKYTAPTVDAVPVVMCEDCLFWKSGKNECESWEWCTMLDRDMPPHAFCSLGARKDEERNER